MLKIISFLSSISEVVCNYLALFQELVSIDCKQAAQMVVTHLTVSLVDVVKQLKAEETVLYEFLQGVMAYR